MMNWKTTVTGVIAALAQSIGPAFPKYQGIIDGVKALALALMGFFAADASATK